MMNESLFFRLLPVEDKAEALAQSVAAVLEGRNQNSIVHAVNPASFRQVPGSPFAYWVSERIRRLFTELPPFESDGRTVKQGLATADDFRFVRAWWEVAPERIVTGTMETTPDQFRQQTFAGKRWVPFAKGGEYSPYYADLHLVVNWEKDGEEMKTFLASVIRNPDFYFRPGLTYPSRVRKFSVSVVPKGCIFSHTSQMLFMDNEDDYKSVCGLYSSLSARFFLSLLTITRKFEVGIVKQLPFVMAPQLTNYTTQLVALQQHLQSYSEQSQNFVHPFQTKRNGNNLEHLQHKIDEESLRVFSLDSNDVQTIQQSVIAFEQLATLGNEKTTENDDLEIQESDDSNQMESSSIHDTISFLIGCIYGRWDIRFATGEKQAPALPDPFAPLPACAPGMLTGENGLPLIRQAHQLRETPPQYPLKIDWDGILVNDPDHSDDLVRRGREVFEVIWKDHAEAIEREACEMLGIKDLREYFRKPGNGGFWMDHVKRYSKSRRKAPIYWLLQSSKKNYALWLYYHRLDKDILFKALVNYVEPKIRLEENRLTQLRNQRAQAGTGGREAKQLEKQLDRQESLLSDLHDFRDKLRRAADLHLEPNLDDGVVLNIAPLWELVPWPEAKKYWEELLARKYEWSFISQQLRKNGMVK